MVNYHYECCCCFSPKTGTYILGVLAILGISQELELNILPRLIASLVTALTFVLMVFNSHATFRFFFCVSYTIMVVTQLVYGYLEGDEYMREKLADDIKKGCQEDKNVPDDKKDECEKAGVIAANGIYIMIWIGISSLTYHFVMTTYRYYRQGVIASEIDDALKI